MKIDIYAKNIELTAPIKAFVEEKVGSISKLLKSAEDESAEAKVEIGRPSRHHKSGPVFYAEANIKVGKDLVRATCEHLDLYTAIDMVRDEIEVQFKKKREKTRDSRRKSKRI
jgi:putative sigma-54 modulation protein